MKVVNVKKSAVPSSTTVKSRTKNASKKFIQWSDNDEKSTALHF